jgi:hypothetical protein
MSFGSGVWQRDEISTVNQSASTHVLEVYREL